MNITYTDDGVPVNEYYMNHPEMMLGKMAFDRHTYGQNSNYTELIVEDEENFNLEEDLNHAISFLSADYCPVEEKTLLPDVNSKEELPNTCLLYTSRCVKETETMVYRLVKMNYGQEI